MKNKIILLLLVWLGLGACNSSNSDTPLTYGTPISGFTVTGRTTDSLGTPAKGIRIIPVEVLRYNRAQVLIREPLAADTLYTSEEGAYEIKKQCRFAREFSLVLQIDDVDSAENGGVFASQKDTIRLTGLDKVGQDGFLKTFFAKQADDIILRPQKPEEEEPEEPPVEDE